MLYTQSVEYIFILDLSLGLSAANACLIWW